MSESTRLNLKTTSAVLAWLLAAGVGMSLLHAHAARPGAPAAAPPRWPAGGVLEFVADRPNLLVFLDPDCPCARATITELEVILAHCGDRAATRVIVVGTEGRAALAALTGFSGVDVRRDEGGVEAARFGVSTSGQALLFGSDGWLVFRGGVTAARGHEGANYGRDAVIGWILGDSGRRSDFPVFGCPLPRLASVGEPAR